MKFLKLSYKLVTFSSILFVSLYLIANSDLELSTIVEYVMIPFLFLSIVIAFITVMFMSVSRVSSSNNLKEKFILNFYESIYSNENFKKKDIKLFKNEVNFYKTKNRDFAHKLFIQFVESKNNNPNLDYSHLLNIYKKLGFYKISLNNLRFDSAYKKAMASYRFSVLNHDYSKVFEVKPLDEKLDKINYSVLFSQAIISKDVHTILKVFENEEDTKFTLEIKSKFFKLFKSLKYDSKDLERFLELRNSKVNALTIAYINLNNLQISSNIIIKLLKSDSVIIFNELCNYLSLKEVQEVKTPIIQVFNNSRPIIRKILLDLFLRIKCKEITLYLSQLNIKDFEPDEQLIIKKITKYSALKNRIKNNFNKSNNMNINPEYV